MLLYDTLSKRKKIFKPLKDKRVNLFVCGPTVYDYSHIGHAKTYTFFDAFKKYLTFVGYNARYIQNITDIDDKIIERANKLGQTPAQLASNFETAYYHDMEKLGIDSVDKYARATDYIPQIISQIEQLTRGSYTYEIKDDGIYFDISKFKDYGKLSGRTADQAEDATSRIDQSVNKKNKGDFALWKLSKLGEPSWDSPWGKGRPGWHIEDTSITESEFGSQYDIHGGGCDLMFPHHEAEIAQMESASGKSPLVNYWMHTGFLTINGQKMSKSLGNFITIHELLREHSKEAFRLFILSSHYRSPVDYQETALAQARANVQRLKEFYQKILAKTAESKTVLDSSYHYPPSPPFRKGGDMARFYEELDDDFNTPKALAVLFELVREGNMLLDKKKLTPDITNSFFGFLDEVNSIFGIIPEIKTRQVPSKIINLANKREELRKENKWQEADDVRIEIEKLGYIIDDTPEGPRYKLKT